MPTWGNYGRTSPPSAAEIRLAEKKLNTARENVERGRRHLKPGDPLLIEPERILARREARFEMLIAAAKLFSR